MIGIIEGKFTLGVIHKTYPKTKACQAELARITYFQQAAVSQNEPDKRLVTASEIVNLNHALTKPVDYFFLTHLFKI